MFNRLKNKSLTKAIAKQINSRDLSSLNGKVASIGILIDATLYQDAIVHIESVGILGFPPHKIQLIKYVGTPRKDEVLGPDAFSKKEVSWKGHFFSSNLTNFTQQPFDMLLAYYTQESLQLDYVVAASKAKFKVGFKDVNDALFDLILHVNPIHLVQYEAELKKYLILLKKIA